VLVEALSDVWDGLSLPRADFRRVWLRQ
jgi:hypothetical protein